MKSKMYNLLFLMICTIGFSQEAQVETPEIICVTYLVDKEAEFPGGLEKLQHFFKQNLKKSNFRGKTFFFEFNIQKDGSIQELKIVRSKEMLTQKEVKKLEKEMPKWSPEIIKSKPTKTHIIVPVDF